jgi:membrane-associated protease RseP (regulator of RpoE activity)
MTHEADVFCVAFHLHELGHLLCCPRSWYQGINCYDWIRSRHREVQRSFRNVLQARAIASRGGGCGFFDGPASRPSQSSDGADAQQSIRSLSLWRRAIIPAGPLSNVALASALFLVVYFRRGNLSVADLAQPDLGLPLLIAGFSMAVARFKLLPVLPLGGGRLALLVFKPCRGRALSTQGEDRLRIHVAGVQGRAGATGAG